jgi:NAD(P)-dependent dehydrogenase (short-subunit alcohol dehydrogenase family)
VHRGDGETCAGDWQVETFGKMKFSRLDQMMAVNVKRPLIVSQALYANVLAGTQKKLIAISSSTGTLSGKGPARAGSIFYPMTKAALNREMQIVAASVKDAGVTVVMFNPGPALTEHQRYLNGQVPDMLEASVVVKHLIETTDKVTIVPFHGVLQLKASPQSCRDNADAAHRERSVLDHVATSWRGRLGWQ